MLVGGYLADRHPEVRYLEPKEMGKTPNLRRYLEVYRFIFLNFVHRKISEGFFEVMQRTKRFA